MSEFRSEESTMPFGKLLLASCDDAQLLATVRWSGMQSRRDADERERAASEERIVWCARLTPTGGTA
jgi:hypothetical protein